MVIYQVSVPTETAFMTDRESHYAASPPFSGAAQQRDLDNTHCWARKKSEKLHSEQGLPWAEHCHLQTMDLRISYEMATGNVFAAEKCYP